MTPTLVDLVLVVVVVLAVVTGFRAGASGQAGTLLGGAVGLLLGGGVATWAAAQVDRPGRTWLVFLAVLVVCVAVGAAVGHRVGRLLGRGLGGVGLGWLDGLLGAALRGGLVLVVCWLLAGVALAVGSPRVDAGIRDSAVLRQVDRTVPWPDDPVLRLGRSQLPGATS